MQTQPERQVSPELKNNASPQKNREDDVAWRELVRVEELAWRESVRKDDLSWRQQVRHEDQQFRLSTRKADQTARTLEAQMNTRRAAIHAAAEALRGHEAEAILDLAERFEAWIKRSAAE